MLPTGNRLRRRQDFETTTRRGRRVGRSSLVVHVLLPEAPAENADRVRASGAALLGDVGQNSSYASNRGVRRHGGVGSARERVNVRSTSGPASVTPRVGFVVSRTVGGAVGRNAIRRRLRHLMRDRLHLLPPGSTVVIRALPPAAAASSADLGSDLDTALARALGGSGR